MPAMEETRDNASPASAPSGQAWLAPTPDSSARAAAAMSQDAISVVAPETLALATPTAVSAAAITGDGAGTQISDDRVPVRCSPRKKTPALAAVKVAASAMYGGNSGSDECQRDLGGIRESLDLNAVA